MWRRRLFGHLTIDESLATACSWAVDSIILTQIGRSAPPHALLQREVAVLCCPRWPRGEDLSAGSIAVYRDGSKPGQPLSAEQD